MKTTKLRTIDELLRVPNTEKTTREWQEQLWVHWPRKELWPGVLDVYEAAAYRRVSHATIRALLVPDRSNRAKLRHQRLGAAYRIEKTDLDNIGLVEGRAA